MRLWWVAAALGVGLTGMAMVPMTLVASTVMTSGTTATSECAPAAPGDPTALHETDQRTNAKTIIETGWRLKIPERGLIVAIATAMQESTLHNLSWGDRDSVGLFQQRTPWGTFAERTNPAISAELFYTGGRGGQPGLLDIAGWESMPITRAAQAVQVSAFPDAYAKWEALARRVVEQVTGGECEPEKPDSPAGPCKGSTDLSNFPNGQIPNSALCPLPFAPGHQLRSDAANAAIKLNAAYKGRFGTPLCVTDSYRTLAEQVDVYRRKPGLAARPGTSNHGWGIAMDLCGGIQAFGTTQHLWMRANGPTFGWYLPEWARQAGSKPEPWHHEYNG